MSDDPSLADSGIHWSTVVYTHTAVSRQTARRSDSGGRAVGLPASVLATSGQIRNSVCLVILGQ